MALIGPTEQERLRARFETELDHDVTLLLFVQPPSGLYIPGRDEPQTARETRQLVEELAALSPRLHLAISNPRLEPELAQRYRIERTPALVLQPGVLAERRDGPGPEPAPEPDAPQTGHGLVRFFGLPAGYEFATLVEDIIDLSRGRTRLTDATRQALAQLPAPLHLQVFVTPT
jgi:hypothetical protein